MPNYKKLIARCLKQCGSRIIWIALGLAQLLLILRSALDLPSGYGAEWFLAFTDEGAVSAAINEWSELGVLAYVKAYLGIDLLLFIPAYAVASISIAFWLMRAGHKHECSYSLACTGIVATSALVAVDFIETTIGLYKLGYSGEETAAFDLWGNAVLGVGAVGCVMLLVCSLGFARDTHQNRETLQEMLGQRWAIWLLGPATIVLLALFFQSALHPFGYFQCGSGEYLWRVGCLAHRGKEGLLIVMLSAYFLGGVCWLSSVGTAANDERARRAKLRAAIGEILLRSRYVLLVLVLSSVLLLNMDQCRDVLIGMLTDLGKNSVSTGIAIVISLIALWTFSHSCWLWARVACRVPGPMMSNDPEKCAEEKYIEEFCKIWARMLGAVPLFVFSLLSALTLHDLVSAGSSEGALELFITAVVGLVLGAFFIVFRERARSRASKNICPDRYFDDPKTCNIGLSDKTWKSEPYKFWFRLLPNAPVWLPLTALTSMILTRLPGAFGWPFPTLVFATMLFAFSVWMGVLGWLWFAERRQAIPWVMLLLVWVGIMGVFGYTDNHEVWTVEQHAGSSIAGHMFIGTASIAALLGAFGWWAVAKGSQAETRSMIVAVLGFVGCLFAVLWFSDGKELNRPQGDTTTGALAGIALDEALKNWLTLLYDRRGPSEPVPVYIVAAEGGGIRAGNWTALVLQKLEKDSKQKGNVDYHPEASFLDRTFAISSVSGSSLGAATVIGCYRSHQEGHNDKLGAVEKCIEDLAMTDLVSPLVGAWFFEDVIAKLIPTRWCATPGCGFLSRGIWFERVLQKSMPVMATGLRASRPNNGSSSNETLNADPNIRGIGQQGHLPYLFLNSTWVESGERAIASEVRIKSESHKDFPTARDTIDIIGQDLTLGTAAHNSARFPFVNAIGAVFTAPEVSAEKTRDSKPILSGHVADGGYFDNSGSHTVIDILRKLRVILFDDAYVGTERSKKVPEWLKVRDWAREVIQPQIIFLHNGSLEPCQLKGGFHQPVRQFVSRRCEKERVSPPYLPEFPHDRGPLKLYSDMFGVPVTGFNATGLGANRFRADSSPSRKLNRYNGCWLHFSVGLLNLIH